MADCNIDYYSGNTAYNGGIIYTDGSGCYWGSLGYDPVPPGQVNINVGGPYIVAVPGSVVEQNDNRKEMNDMIGRQTFLDALADEGKSVGSEGREVIKEAKADKWELFIARLLAKAFESADLAMLKEKPKQVEVLTTKEA